MHRVLLFFLLLASPLFSAEPWPGVAYTEIRAYAWPGKTNGSRVVLDDMKLAPDVINKDGAVLTPEQTRKLTAAITGTHPKYDVARCHTPRNAFVFYDAAKKPVAYVEVCFTCFSNRMSPQGQSPYVDLASIASLFEELKLPIGAYPSAKAFKKDFEKKSRLVND